MMTPHRPSWTTWLSGTALACSLLALLASPVTDLWAGLVSRPTKSFGGTTYVNDIILQASDLNGDMDTLYNEFNGNITDANVSATAAIAATKLRPFPAGTAIVVAQANCPTGGWTKLAAQNDKALRVVSGGTGGSAGGTVAFSTAWSGLTAGNASVDHTHTGPSHAHTGPSHTHTLAGSGVTVSDVTTSAAVGTIAGGVANALYGALTFGGSTVLTGMSKITDAQGTGATGTGGTGATAGQSTTHNHTISGSTAQYLDVIVCTKD